MTTWALIVVISYGTFSSAFEVNMAGEAQCKAAANAIHETYGNAKVVCLDTGFAFHFGDK